MGRRKALPREVARAPSATRLWRVPTREAAGSARGRRDIVLIGRADGDARAFNVFQPGQFRECGVRAVSLNERITRTGVSGGALDRPEGATETSLRRRSRTLHARDEDAFVAAHASAWGAVSPQIAPWNFEEDDARCTLRWRTNL